MKTMFLLLLFVWGFEKAEAAAAPVRDTISRLEYHPSWRIQPPVRFKKQSLLQKLQWKLLQKRIKQVSHHRAASTGRESVLSTIALILGLLGVLFLFISSLAGLSILFAVGALITGFIALSKRNKANGTKTKAIIAVVLGGLTLLLWLVIIVAFIGFLGAWE
jgi:Flp pilus assembly protein TadB